MLIDAVVCALPFHINRKSMTVFHCEILNKAMLTKAHTQAKIIKKSVILFWLLNMTINYDVNMHIDLEMQKFFLIFVLRIYQLG